MKTLTSITATFFVALTAFAAPGDKLVRISDATGVPVETLHAQRAATGLGYGELETANLLSNASGQSFDTIVARHQRGEGWGRIAQDYGFKLGDIKSAAHRSDQAALHARGHGTNKSEFVRERGRFDDENGRGHGKGPNSRGKGKSHK